MKKFKIDIASHIIGVESVYDAIYVMCRKFLTDGEPSFCVKITPEDLKRERVYLGLEKNAIFPESQIEVLYLMRIITDLFIDDDILLIHGAAISVNNQAFLFTADSGVGKTVHSIRWILNNKDTTIINGDKPFIILKDKPLICGSPWSGKEGRHSNVTAPLKSIILMERSENNHIERISFSDAFPFILRQVYRPNDPKKMKKTLELMQKLGSSVSFWYFRCNNFKDDCYKVSYNALVD